MSTSPQPAPAKVVPVDFTKPKRPTLKSLGSGVYAYPRPCSCGVMVQPSDARCPACNAKAPDVVFWERPFIDGRQTQRRLKSTTLRHAQLEAGSNRSNKALSEIGRAVDPYAKESVWTVSQVLKFYADADCPQRNEKPRTGKQLDEEKKHVENLTRHLGSRLHTKIALDDLRDYHQARTKEIAENGCGRGPGHRTVDIECRALSSAFRWCLKNSRKTGVTSNPVAHDRTINCRPETVRHCRDVMPADGDELHRLATIAFESKPTEVFGWQLLFESMIGQRTSEILKLRTDAGGPGQAGFIDGKHLYLHRSATAKGTAPFIEIHPALARAIAAHRIWLETRFPGCAWWFPSPRDGKRPEPVRSDGLTRALARITAAAGLPHRTSHGLRAFYVTVLRSQGISDGEIALRIGQKSGGRLVVSVYGERLPVTLDWLPKDGKPAWQSGRWLKADARNGRAVHTSVHTSVSEKG